MILPPGCRGDISAGVYDCLHDHVCLVNEMVGTVEDVLFSGKKQKLAMRNIANLVEHLGFQV